MFPKPVRKKDEKLLAEIRKNPCAVCGQNNVEVHHLASRGSGGPDSIGNCVPLCRQHHTEIHQLGLIKMCEVYPEFQKRLLR